MRVHPAFEQGFVAAASSGGLLLVALYTLYAPTTDIRARVPFLLDLGGGLLTLVALCILLVVGSVALLVTQPLTKEGLGGVAVASLGNLFVLTSGLLSRLLPPLESMAQRGAAFALATLLVATLLWRQRRSLRKRSAALVKQDR